MLKLLKCWELSIKIENSAQQLQTIRYILKITLQKCEAV